MKTLLSFVAITATAALNTGLAHAQLLGGGLGGSMSNGVGGALSGSMMDRSGALDSRFGSTHSLRAGDNFDAQPDVSGPTIRTKNTTARLTENGKQTTDVAGHSAAGKADSTGNTALNDGTSAVHAGKAAAAGDVNSARTARTEAAGTAAQTQSPVQAATTQAATSGQASGGANSASNTHINRGAQGWSAGSQNSAGAGASGTVEQ